MPDVYARITEASPETVAAIADVLELTARDAQLAGMTAAYVADLALAEGARVLEVGCGTGAVARAVAALAPVGEVLGVDPSAGLVARARELAAGDARLRFEVGDGRALALPDGSFDAVVLHRVLSHVPDQDAVLAEAARVLRPGGRLAVFDGDYASFDVALGTADPLRACTEAFQEAYVGDPWVTRRLPGLVAGAGLRVEVHRGTRLVQAAEPAYLLTVVDRGADALVASGLAGRALGRALKHEARERVAAGRFVGSVGYASVVARKPYETAGADRPG